MGCLYLAVTPGHYQSIDGMLMFHQARSLLYDGALIFREPFLWQTVYDTSLYGIGQSLVYLPTLALFSGLESLVFHPGPEMMDFRRVYLDDVYALAAAPVQAALTAAAAHRVAALGRALGLERRTSLWGLVLFGVGSPALLYARSDFSQPLTALCAVVALDRAVHFAQTSAGRDLFVCGAAIAFGVLTRPLDAGLLLPFVALVCLASPGRNIDWQRARRVGIALGGAFTLACGISLLINAARYGSFYHNEYAALGARWVAPWPGVAGLLVSPARGLLWAFPAIWLAPVGMRALWRQQDRRPAVVALVGFSLALLLATGSWHMWWGGECWGPRLMAPALPSLAVLAAAGLAELPRRWRGLAGWALLFAGVNYAAPGVATDHLVGFGGRTASSAGSFALENYPPLTAWRFVTHTFARSPIDPTAVDIVWLRIAQRTHFFSLLPFVTLLALAGWLGTQVRLSLTGAARR